MLEYFALLKAANVVFKGDNLYDPLFVYFPVQDVPVTLPSSISINNKSKTGSLLIFLGCE